MKSYTKYEIDNKSLLQICDNAKLKDIISIKPLIKGEFNSAFSITTKEKEYVLKVSPKEGTRVLTYEKNLMHQELYYYQLIKENTDIKVPEIYYCDLEKSIISADYFIMQKINLPSMINAKLSREDKRKLNIKIGKNIAKLHSIEVKGYGYRQNIIYSNWYEAIRSMVTNISNDLKSLGKSQFKVAKLLDYIDMFKSILYKVESSYTHFDIWAGNIFCDKKEDDIDLVLIDMERSFMGDRLGDFVSLQYLTLFNNKTDIIDGYNSIADKKIEFTLEENIRYYIMQAYLGLIVNTEKYVRYKKFGLKYQFNALFSRMLLRQAFNELGKLNNKLNE